MKPGEGEEKCSRHEKGSMNMRASSKLVVAAAIATAAAAVAVTAPSYSAAAPD